MTALANLRAQAAALPVARDAETIADLRKRLGSAEGVIFDFVASATERPNGTTKKWLRTFSEFLGL